jgi:ATP-dependent Clp protease ATP-binding subunit ClpA
MGKLPSIMTDQARELLSLAKSCARRFGLEDPTPSHFLMAMKTCSISIANHALANIGVDIQLLCSTVEITYLEAGVQTRKSEKASEIMTESCLAANRLGLSYISTEHLILASLRVNGPIVEPAFIRLGLSAEDVATRAEEWIRQMMARGAALSERKQAGEKSIKDWLRELMAQELKREPI